MFIFDNYFSLFNKNLNLRQIIWRITIHILETLPSIKTKKLSNILDKKQEC